MSDTPRTDDQWDFAPYHAGLWYDFARELEHELNEANAQLRSLKLELKESYNLKDSLVKGHLELGETLKEANADRLRLREALERCRADRGERDKVLIHCHVLDQYQEGKQ
jgi:hypothetical protein